MSASLPRGRYLRDLPEYPFARLDAKRREMESKGMRVIDLGIGDPSEPTPQFIQDVLAGALPRSSGYPRVAGIPELRQGAAGWLKRRFGVDLDPDKEILPVNGSKEAIHSLPLALVSAARPLVLVPVPAYPVYGLGVSAAGGELIRLPLHGENGYLPDLDTVPDETWAKAAMLWINYPHNPTGGVIPESGLRAIAEAAAKYNVPVLSDEIYARILYDGEHRSIAAMPGMESLAIVLDGFSKTYAMTGWRLGYGIMPAPMAQVVAKLQTNATSCTATFSQLAAVQALRGDQSSVDAMVAEFRRRRDAIVDGLRAIPGLGCARPKGAFYVFPNITRTGYGSKALADKLLDQGGVACLSGTAFGEFGEGHLRFSYANSMENIQEALRRIASVVGR
jgi:aspartate/methionine/tyrosine aminotransferase